MYIHSEKSIKQSQASLHKHSPYQHEWCWICAISFSFFSLQFGVNKLKKNHFKKNDHTRTTTLVISEFSCDIKQNHSKIKTEILHEWPWGLSIVFWRSFFQGHPFFGGDEPLINIVSYYKKPWSSYKIVHFRFLLFLLLVFPFVCRLASIFLSLMARIKS